MKKSGELYQAKFTNRSNQEWFGSIIKTDLEPDDGDAETEIWKAHQKMPKPDNRKIWTALPGITEINNFKKVMYLQLMIFLNSKATFSLIIGMTVPILMDIAPVLVKKEFQEMKMKV